MPPIGNVTCQPNNVTTEDPSNIGKDDLNALLYIVVTLLFYSMGIIIGIITYLKREQADMEEDKMFDMYMQLKREPFNLYKRERVQQMALYLKQLEEQQAAREKIENWRTVEHLQRFQPCRRHGYRHSSCPDCSKTSPIPEICHGYDEATGFALSEGSWAESGGGTALLCSLTLGVCEPLLTPESIKRVAFPDSAHLESKSLNSSIQGTSLFRPYPCVPSKSSFRHNSLTVHYSNNTTSLPRDAPTDKISGNEFKQPSVKAPPPETTFDSPSMFDKGDIELKELRQFNYEEVKAVFQNSAVEVCNPNACDNTSFNTQTIPSLHKDIATQTTTSGKGSALTRQLSHDAEYKSYDLAVHAPLRKNDNANADSNNDYELSSVDKRSEEGSLPSPQVETCTTNKEELVDNKLSRDITNLDANEAMQQSQLNQQEEEQQPRVQEQHYPQQPRQELPLTVAPIIIPSTIPWHSPQQCELPLHLFVLAQQQPQLGHVRPKVFCPIPNIPQSVSRDETVTMCASSPNSTLPQTTQPINNPLYDTLTKCTPQSVDISDVTRARKLGLNWKNKTIEKKTAPRSQPERRGALFFTQRSLQKDSDSPKSVSGRKHSRPTVFSRQESLDSYNSRTSETSENIDSPHLHHSSDIDSGMNPSSSNSMSPPATSKQARGISRLVRSHTVDTSKLLQE